ncbi:aminotransferase class III-fold pyridoxal phosphate-dependent enzyme [Robiginitalea sp. SC105]|uniref:aminotransferase class III-fold pyridoxal phosphate-dependent enzyme n=1 Tax=Robiginitalea sp. SC105 TaxID=2762332 RepID=UPI00163A9F52|nr:aminotransferase class III-fold pyridoxal phosphate-dependent enzyme [Robiginitalea sp. SC105]MBC2840482.1 aminotransferase class III-fold pyridoxal phosphate-dependent enzyme [Robiginitalea sp. SC105]
MEALFAEIKRHYGLEPTSVEPLEGYEDRTFRMQAAGGRWVLKEHRPGPGRKARIELESRLMEHFRVGARFEYPAQLPVKAGGSYFEYDGKLYRVLEYLEGGFMAEATQDERFLQSLGRLLGELAGKAAGFGAVPVSPDPFAWDLQHLGMSQQYNREIADPRIRSLTAYMYRQFQAEVLPMAYSLRRGFIHNDANDWNILVRDGEVTGLIDFGDACYSWLAADLAVGITYGLMNKEDPLQAAATILGAYHAVFPIAPDEADLLYYLIGGRLCMSLCQAAHTSKSQPDSPYITISQAAVEKLIEQWVRIGPVAARRTFRKVTGLPQVPATGEETFRKRRNRLLSPSLSLSYRHPIIMERAAFQYMFGNDGTSYLDAYNNIMQVGHCHPEVVARTSEALRTLNTNTRYHYESILSYAEALLKHFPPSLSRVFFVNSGSAATDLALRLARFYTGRNQVMALENGYHGNTSAGIAISHYKHRPGHAYPNTLLCPMPKVFGSGWADDGTAGRHLSESCLGQILEHGESLAAFIAEPIMGCGGQVPLPHGYLERVYQAVRKIGGLCISDEVQVGFGRLGEHFWGYERYGVVPDLVILGKPMGNGHPLGAVVCTEEIARAFAEGPEFFSSFGGNPVSCAAGKAVLDVLEDENLPRQAAETGEYLMRCLRELGEESPLIADVRGDGLFIGVELLLADGKPATRKAAQIKDHLREERVLISTDGPFDNVLKIKPPLPFNRGNADELLEKLGAFLRINDNSS